LSKACYKCKKEPRTGRVWKPVNILWCMICYVEQRDEGIKAVKKLPSVIEELPLVSMGSLHEWEIDVRWSSIQHETEHIH